jgi:subtilisin family serine protease
MNPTRVARKSKIMAIAAGLLIAVKSYAGAEFVPGEVLVKFKDEASLVAIRNAIGPGRSQSVGRLKRVILTPGADVEQEVARLNQKGEVEYAQPVYIKRLQVIPNDPLFNQQWALRNNGQAAPSVGTRGADINVVPAWDITTGSRDVVVAIIDTGLDLVHPELSQNVWTNPGEILGDGIDNDGDGFVDDVHGWDWTTNQPLPLDVDGHGTIVAGIIGATGDNRANIAGVNWRVSIMPLKVFDAGGTAMTTHIIEAIRYAVDHGARIINASYGSIGSATDAGRDFDRAEYEAFRYAQDAGVLVVAAACNTVPFGNSNDDLSQTCVPASYPLGNIIAVGSSDNNDAMASFSNFGVQSVDLVAPGVDVITTAPSFIQLAYRTHISGFSETYNLENSVGCKAVGAASLYDVTDGDPGPYLGDSSNSRPVDLSGFAGILKAQSPVGAINWRGVTIVCYDVPTNHSVSTQTGTSVSAPLVSGVAALALAEAEARNQTPGVADLRAMILGGVDPKPLLEGKVATGGRLNAAKVLASLTGARTQTAPSSPGSGGTGALAGYTAAVMALLLLVRTRRPRPLRVAG